MLVVENKKTTLCLCIGNGVINLTDRELLAAKLRLESDFTAQRSAMNENRSRVEMLENVLAKEAVMYKPQS